MDTLSTITIPDLVETHGQKGNWVVYVLSSIPRPHRTYCGVTNDLKHRLRQHNGEIKGGAVATRTDRPWKLSALAVGFGDDKSTAMRFEWFCKVKNYKPSCIADAHTFGSIKTGPSRRMYLMNYSKTKCIDLCPNLEIFVCEPKMVSEKEYEAKMEDVKKLESQRSCVVSIVV
jgi:predicted GIY-YIG superfamily endonuclease